MNSLRGASSSIGIVRAVRYLFRMTPEEGESAGVDNHKAYFSVEGEKFNKSAEDTTRRWFKLSGRDMPNAENVGQLFRWHWPDTFVDLSEKDVVAILNKLSEGTNAEIKIAVVAMASKVRETLLWSLKNG